MYCYLYDLYSNDIRCDTSRIIQIKIRKKHYNMLYVIIWMTPAFWKLQMIWTKLFCFRQINYIIYGKQVRNIYHQDGMDISETVLTSRVLNASMINLHMKMKLGWGLRLWKKTGYMFWQLVSSCKFRVLEIKVFIFY